jgi:hypothetical protein
MGVAVGSGANGPRVKKTQKAFNCKEFAWDKVLNRGSKRIRRRCKIWSSVKSWRQYERVEKYDAEVQGQVQWDAGLQLVHSFGKSS